MKRRKKRGLMWPLAAAVLVIGFGIGIYWGRQPQAPSRVEHQPHRQQQEAAYAYSTLNETQKEVYDQMVYAIEERKEYVSLATTDQEEMKKAYWAVRYDHCEYFWTDSYRYEVFTNRKGETTALYFRPEFTMDEKQQEEYQKQIDASADQMLEGISDEASDYEKALYVYRTLIEQTEYVVDSENNQNIISTFVNHETVCQGYSYGAQYLLNRLGVACTTVCGTAEGTNHSWNLLVMDGEYYYMDVTWGEAEYWASVEADDQAQGTKDVVNYSYFGVSDADENFISQHKAFDYVPMPECTAMENNYFVHEGLYFEQWDPDQAGSAIRKAYDQGQSTVSLKFANEDLYDQAFYYLIEENNWSRYCNEKQIAYVDGFDMNVLMLRFMN